MESGDVNYEAFAPRWPVLSYDGREIAGVALSRLAFASIPPVGLNYTRSSCHCFRVDVW